MEINWYTFAAQIINFLVLVWLLRRFLYRPVIDAMDTREKKIAERLDEAAEARRDSEREAGELRRKQDELEHAREELMAEAAREIESWKKQHREQARDEIDAERKEWYRGIQRERNAFLRALRAQAGEYVYETTRDVVRKLSDEALEQRVVDVFLTRLRTLDAHQQSEIAAAIRDALHRVTVRSGFPISDDVRQRILVEVQRCLGNDVEIEFQVSPEVICGLELQAAGYKVAWSAGETLDGLEEDFSRTLDEAALG